MEGKVDLEEYVRFLAGNRDRDYFKKVKHKLEHIGRYLENVNGAKLFVELTEVCGYVSGCDRFGKRRVRLWEREVEGVDILGLLRAFERGLREGYKAEVVGESILDMFDGGFAESFEEKLRERAIEYREE